MLSRANALCSLQYDRITVRHGVERSAIVNQEIDADIADHVA